MIWSTNQDIFGDVRSIKNAIGALSDLSNLGTISSTSTSINSKLTTDSKSVAQWLKSIDASNKQAGSSGNVYGTAKWLSMIFEELRTENSSGVLLSISEWSEIINDKLTNSGKSVTQYVKELDERNYSGGKSSALWLNNTYSALHSNNSSGASLSVADWTSLINDKLLKSNRSAADYLSTIDASNLAPSSVGNIYGTAKWLQLQLDDLRSESSTGTTLRPGYMIYTIMGRLNDASSGWSVGKSSKATYDILKAEKDKEADALSDYSSSGGRSASDTSSDVGAISGSISGNMNSGVSASSALNAVSDNQSDFQYFFFGMKNDLDTSSGGSRKNALKSARSNDTSSGEDVPDFLTDYWEGLENVK